MNTAPARPAPHTTRPSAADTGTPARRWPPGFTVAVGAFYTGTAGIHVGIVAADTGFYREFAAGSPWAPVRAAWADVFMADPQLWGLLTAAAEVVLGVLLLLGGRAAKAGYAGVAAFQVALVAFGWGFLWWSVPALGVLLLGARRDWPHLARPHPARRG